MWYLNAETVALAFFDDEISVDVKRKMVTEIDPYDEMNEIHPKPFQLNLKQIDTFCHTDLCN